MMSAILTEAIVVCDVDALAAGLLQAETKISRSSKVRNFWIFCVFI